MANMFQIVFSLLVQFLLFTLTEAAPVTAQHNNAWKYGASGGVVGFIVLILDLIVFSMYICGYIKLELLTD